MAQKKNPTSEKAETLYRKGLKLSDIADRLGVPAATVRRWKSSQNWDDPERRKKEARRKEAERNANARKANAKANAKNGTESERKANVKKSGGQKGNVNSVCGGRPRGIQPLTHGGYSSVYWDKLTDEEREIIETMNEDPELQLIDQIRLYAVSEHRIMAAIDKLSKLDNSARDGLGVFTFETATEEQKRAFSSPEEEEQYREMVRSQVTNGKRLPGERYTVTTTKRSTVDQVTRLLQQLATTQSKKTEAIRALEQVRADKRREEAEEGGNSAINAWIESLREIEGGERDG